MADLIDRHEAISKINEYGSVWMEYTDEMSKEEIAERALKASKNSMIRILDELPSVTPPHPTAHKLVNEDGDIRCSKCGSSECWGNYCMECGSKMEGDE